jgi:hypothetical protein
MKNLNEAFLTTISERNKNNFRGFRFAVSGTHHA